MNDRSLFAPAPRRKRGLILTLAGSLLFHGSLIGVAALWATHPAEPPPSGPTEVGFYDPSPSSEPLPLPVAPPSEPEPIQPEFKVAAPVEPPPPSDEPDINDMSLSTPVPRSVARTAAHAVSASAEARPLRAQAGPPTTNVATGGATGSSGAGRPGPGVRWNTPRPAYPAPLRLARVQGSGSVRVTTDGSGRVVSAVIVQSTGNALLDDHTCRAAKSDWSGPPNTTTSIPITYRLQ